MRRLATDRLAVAAALSLTGALVAVLVGMAEVALFVAPWMVLCTLGLTRPSSADLRAEIELDRDRVIAGDVVTLTARIRLDRGERRIRVEPLPSRWFESDPDSSSAKKSVQRAAVVLAAHDAGAAGPTTDDAVFELPATSWGAHDLGRMAVQVVEPYGLFRTFGTVTLRRPVRVHPTPRQLSDLLTPWTVRRVAGTHPSPESATGVEYADIREYTTGDSVRDINWRASARSRELLVSQRHPDRASDVILLVDSFVESGHDVRAVFGLVVEAAVSLAESHLAATDRVGLIEFGGLVRWVTPSTGPVQLQRLTDALLATGLYANAADKEFPILPTRALPPRSLVVAFTPLLDQRFVDAIRTARGRGHDVAVVVCDPVVPAVSSRAGRSFGRRNTSEEARDASRAVETAEQIARRIWTAERAMTRDRLAEHGIAVVSWDGDEPFDVTLGRLRVHRRRAMRIGGAR